MKDKLRQPFAFNGGLQPGLIRKDAGAGGGLRGGCWKATLLAGGEKLEGLVPPLLESTAFSTSLVFLFVCFSGGVFRKSLKAVGKWGTCRRVARRGSALPSPREASLGTLASGSWGKRRGPRAEPRPVSPRDPEVGRDTGVLLGHGRGL